MPASSTGTTTGVVGPTPGEKERKKRKRSVPIIEDEIDALFDGALGRKVARSALIVGDPGNAPAPTPLRTPTTATRQEKRGDKNADYGLGAVVEAIREAPMGGEGKKRRKRQLG